MLTNINSSYSMNATSFELKWPLTKTFKMLKETKPHSHVDVCLHMYDHVCLRENVFLLVWYLTFLLTFLNRKIRFILTNG